MIKLSKQAIALGALALVAPLAGAQTVSGSTAFGGSSSDQGNVSQPGEVLMWQARMGEPVHFLDAEQRNRFFVGRAMFNTPLPENEGLGPIFNDVSCGNCHSIPDVGGASSFLVTRFGKAAVGGNPFDPLDALGGSLLQLQAIDPNCMEVVPPEATVTAERLTPICFGAGLVESIVDADIVAGELNPPPGVSGQVRMVQPVEGGPMRPGRFGWKGGVATVLTFSADASLNEMGLTNTFFQAENAPNGDQVLLAQCDTVADPEDQPDAFGVTRIERFTDFQRMLAAPPQTPKSGMTGETVFEMIGCAACHVSTPFVTGPGAEPQLENVPVKPYSDFLLHDMGAMGDAIVDGPADETHMSTRAIWGISLRGSMLHDGRSTGGTFEDNLTDAIVNHDGEAAASRTAFMNLPQVEKDQLLAFMRSLGQAEFDMDPRINPGSDADHDVDEFDWFFIEPILTGPNPAVAYTPDDFEAINDVDQDGDVDLIDLSVFQRAFTGQ